jgi:hypothetical protein
MNEKNIVEFPKYLFQQAQHQANKEGMNVEDWIIVVIEKELIVADTGKYVRAKEWPHSWEMSKDRLRFNNQSDATTS